MRSRSVCIALFLLVPAVTSTQPSPSRGGIRQAESEVWKRLEERARRLGAFVLDSSELDLRIPIQGEPEEVMGVTRLTNSSVVVATARLEPLDSIGSRQDPFYSGRYDLRLEDRVGNCLVVHQTVSVDSVLRRLKRTVESCRPLYMAEVFRRSIRLARIPLSAGQLTDNWSVAPATTAFIDVYVDSVVVLTTKLMLQVNLREGDTTGVRIDSVTVGLALGDRSWSIVLKSPAARVDTVLHRGELWSRAPQRFMIPVDSTFALTRSWPVVEVVLGVPKTKANPYGLAWTYAHGPKDFFKGVRWTFQAENSAR
ncbi:MAG TPA: hypothetical protein VGQ52_09345 [Gemmatimonadaceae bacterium]|nr:hypothetical protein [Gemmatimonadaceae bacterium]